MNLHNNCLYAILLQIVKLVKMRRFFIMSKRRAIGAMYESYPAKRLVQNSGNVGLKLLVWALLSGVWYFVNLYVIFGLAGLLDRRGLLYFRVGAFDSQTLFFCIGSLLLLIMVGRSNIGN